MNTTDVQIRLLALSTSLMKLLASEAGVSERGLWKIRSGKTVTVSEPIKEKIVAGLRKLPRKARK